VHESWPARPTKKISFNHRNRKVKSSPRATDDHIYCDYDYDYDYDGHPVFNVLLPANFTTRQRTFCSGYITRSLVAKRKKLSLV